MELGRLKTLCVLALVGLGVTVSACSAKSETFCSQSVSVAGVATLFSHGLQDLPESQYESLRDDLAFAYNAAIESIKNETDSSGAAQFAVDLQKFISIMNGLHWDFSAALLNDQAMGAANKLGTNEALLQANAVESFVINHCGMPSTVANELTEDTLPFPVVSAPNATDPPSAGINQDSEYIATGKLLGNIYGLTLTDEESRCVGAALAGVYDVSSTNADISQYVSQFQKAFTQCGINVVIPANP